MCAQQLQGKQVRLVALKSDSDIEVMSHWPVTPGVWRLLDVTGGDRHGLGSLPAAEGRVFRVQTLTEDRPIGQARLFGVCPDHADAWLDVSFHRREHWGQPSGGETLRVLVQYAFDELGLRRLTLGVFDYNARVLRSYEEAGFVIEGRMLYEAPGAGRSRAGVYMGLWREAWEK